MEGSIPPQGTMMKLITEEQIRISESGTRQEVADLQLQIQHLLVDLNVRYQELDRGSKRKLDSEQPIFPNGELLLRGISV